MTKCFTVELAARHRFFRTLPHCLWLPHAPSPLHSDREAHQPFHVCIPGTWAMSGISLLPWWDPSLLAFMELIRSHLLLNLPQITENEKVGLCSTVPLGKKEIVPTKARGHVPHNISHFFFKLWFANLSGEENSYPLQYSCSGEFPGWRSLVGYCPWGQKESDTTELLTFPLTSNV